MAYTGPASGEAREPGARRRKIAEYFKTASAAANDFRQNYFQGTDQNVYGKDKYGQEYDGSFPDAAIVTSGNEEMILFPSYARKHTKEQQDDGRGTNGNGAEYWQREWSRHETHKALVDVDVRGWIYAPQRGPVTRRQRLLIGIARQLSGIPAPASTGSEPASRSSRTASPERSSKQDEDLIALEAEQIMQRGKIEAEFAGVGAFSEEPGRVGVDVGTFSGTPPSTLGHRRGSGGRSDSSDDDGVITPIQKRDSWAQPSKMSAAELTVANKHLLHRLRPFMATPLVESPVQAFFYNETTSRQKTVFTNPSGHFSCRATLDFVPTHVRLLAGNNLSATEEVIVTSPQGVSLISDIDDTIKHSAISAGPREIFRNAFIRDLGDLTIEGVREWYTRLSNMNVKLHYVSNSPWQIYPILTSFFKIAGLPRGSFHLKQYTGMLQGIFEPVAERKKSSLDRIMRDFPERKFILVGDSGEADLEVYTEVVLEHPGRVLGIFIRDVTSPPGKSGFFDSNGRPGPRSRHSSKGSFSDGLSMSKRISRPNDTYDEDAQLQAAIAASLKDAESETGNNRIDLPPLPARVPSSPLARAQMSASPEEDLIDLNDIGSPQPWVSVNPWGLTVSNRRRTEDVKIAPKSTPSPPPPRKPDALRAGLKQPPPVPKRPSTAVRASTSSDMHIRFEEHEKKPSPLAQVQRQESVKSPPPLPARRNYREMAREKIGNVLPSTPKDGMPIRQRPTTPRALTSSRIDAPRPLTAISPLLGGQKHPDLSSIPDRPLTSQRRVGSTSSLGSLRKATNRMSSGYSDDGLPNSPGEAGMTKKEFIWMQRLIKARGILERQGVTLRTWRVGNEAQDICVKLVEMAQREFGGSNSRS